MYYNFDIDWERGKGILIIESGEETDVTLLQINEYYEKEFAKDFHYYWDQIEEFGPNAVFLPSLIF